MNLIKKFTVTCTLIYLLVLSLFVHAQPIKHLDKLAIYSKDGTKISANVFMPSDSQEPLPLIIMPNSWNLDEYEYTFPAKHLAAQGFIVLSYSTRGWGRSEGTVDVASADDLEDIDAIINWAQLELPINSQKIGMAGISYGGGITLLAAAHDPRIKAIAVMSAWSNLETALYGNKSPSMLWGSLLVNSGKVTGRLDPEINVKFQNLVNHTHVKETKTWATPRSPIAYIDQLNRNKTAVYLSQNLGDRLFKSNMMLDLFEQLDTPKKMDLNQGIHASAEASGLLGFDNYVWNQTYRWFDYWLKGNNNGIHAPPYLSIEVKKGKRISLERWPIQSTKTRYYLQKRPKFTSPGELSDQQSTMHGTDTLQFGWVTGVHSGIPIVSPILDAENVMPITAWLPGINPITAIYYQTKPMTADKTLLGIPKITLWYKPSIQESQLIAYLYDVDRYGFGTLISHAPVSRYHDLPGNFIVTEFDLMMAAHQIAKGHRIALAFGTYDVLYTPPSTQKHSLELAYGGEMSSNIQIPYIENKKHHDKPLKQKSQ